MSKEEFLKTEQELLLPKPIETYVEGVGKVLYRRPTRKDRLESKIKAREHPLWNEMDEKERKAQETVELIKLIVLEPKGFTSKFEELDLLKSDAIIDVISLELAEETAELTRKRHNRIQNFLEKRRAELSQMRSLPYFKELISTSKEQEKSS